MQICCTKKLLDELPFQIEEATEENDLFSWSANLILINRRKTLVIVNDSNQFGIILYGLKKKHFQEIDKLILSAIKTYLKEEKIKEEVINKYINEAGKIKFTKTRARKYIARVNSACERAAYFKEYFNTNEVIQKYATMKMNTILVKFKNTYEYPYELLYKDLISFSVSKDIISCEAVDLNVKLDLGEHSAWRKIVTPSDITFKQLHQILQITFQWHDYHLYDFNVFDDNGKLVLNIVSEYEEIFEEGEGSVKFDKDVILRDYATIGRKIVYCYDYGDNWEHIITVQGIRSDYNNNYPKCLLGSGETPPEDVGGLWGYKEFLSIMANPKHEDYHALKEWSINQRHMDFDIDFVNAKLKGILREY